MNWQTIGRGDGAQGTVYTCSPALSMVTRNLIWTAPGILYTTATARDPNGSLWCFICFYYLFLFASYIPADTSEVQFTLLRRDIGFWRADRSRLTLWHLATFSLFFFFTRRLVHLRPHKRLVCLFVFLLFFFMLRGECCRLTDRDSKTPRSRSPNVVGRLCWCHLMGNEYFEYKSNALAKPKPHG